MEIHTLVSLTIGIFGASYAALNALRMHADPKVVEACKLATEKLKKVAELPGGTQKKRYANCEKHCNRAQQWKGIWDFAHVVPAALFFIAMALVVTCVWRNWDIVAISHAPTQLQDLHKTEPWCHFKTGFIVMCSLDLSALIFAFCAWGIVTYSSARVGEIHEADEDVPVTDPGNNRMPSSSPLSPPQ